jgi:hypothetical protein
MNNSSVCTFILNGITRPKKRYLTAEAAHKAAKDLNNLPTTIHKFGEYKCTTCFYFHVGRTKKVLQHDHNIYHNK